MSAWICKYCGTEHKTRRLLKEHIKTTHGPFKNSRRLAGWECPICHDILSTRAELSNHRKTMHGKYHYSTSNRHSSPNKCSSPNKWVCKYCNNTFQFRRILYEHYHTCEAKNKLPTDTLNRTINIEGQLKSSRTIAERKLNGTLKVTPHPHSEQTKKLLSIKRIEYLESHPNHGLKWYTVNGIKVQGTWEYKFALWLNEHGIKWDRRRYLYNKTHHYTPDFHCIDSDIFFEVKGFLRDRDIYKMHLVLKDHPNMHIKLIEKNELSHLDSINIFDLPDFNTIHPLNSIDMSKFHNVWK